MSRFLALSLTLTIAGFSFARVLLVSAQQLDVPQDLAYESPIQRSVDVVREGRNPYDSKIYDDGPFVLTMYTPAYFWLTSLLPSPHANPFWTSRAVACLSMFLAAGTVLLVLPRRETSHFSLLACSAFFLIGPVVKSTAVARNDSLGLLFSALAVVLLARTKGRALPLVAVLCCLAFWTKQSFLAASATAVIFVVTQDRRRGVAFAGSLAALFAATGLWAHGLFGTGLWFSTLVATQNPFQLDQMLKVWRSLLVETGFVSILAALAWLAWQTWRRRGRGMFSRSPFPLYVLATAPSFVLVGKLGAGTNYLFEFCLASLMWLAFEMSRTRASSRAAAGLLLVWLVATTREVGFKSPAEYSFVPWATSRQVVAFRSSLARDLGPTRPGPDRVLNLLNAAWTYEMGVSACSDPYLYSLLWTSGKLGLRSVTTAVRSRRYEAVVVPLGGLATSYGAESAALLAIMRVAKDHYPARVAGPGYEIWLPEAPGALSVLQR